jgi:heme/copper-type cytochrome/quinol oxidase subunit 2
MDILGLLRLLFAILILLFVPGFLLVQALFPKKNELSEEDDWLYRIVLSVVLSIVIAIILAFVISSLGEDEDTGKGYFTALNITVSLLVISAVLFAIGVLRGAYPVIYTRKRDRVDSVVDPEKGRKVKEQMKRYRELKLGITQLKANLEEDLSYKARTRFKRELAEKEEELAALSKSLNLEQEEPSHHRHH